MARLTSTPGAGSTARAGPIGISGEAATAMATASSAPVTVIDGEPGQGQRDQGAPGRAEGAQHRELRRVQRELPGEQLAEHDEGDQAGQRGEGRERDGLRAGGLLKRGHLVGLADHVDPPAGTRVAGRARVLSGQGAGGGEEPGHGRARPAAGPRPGCRR